jgi:hypothetical protein
MKNIILVVLPFIYTSNIFYYYINNHNGCIGDLLENIHAETVEYPMAPVRKQEDV